MPQNTLARVLTILESIGLASKPLRFSEIKALNPKVPDSTLTRLLRSLERSGHVQRLPDIGYAAGPALHRWKSAIQKTRRNFHDLAVEILGQLTEATQEAAAIALFKDNEIRVVSSKTVPGAVWVVTPGAIMHIEEDHAAVLAILDQLPERRRDEVLKSRYSRIRSDAVYRDGVKAARGVGGLWLDRSRERPGICRMAISFRNKERLGVIFLCLTVESERQHRDALVQALRAAQVKLAKTPC